VTREAQQVIDPGWFAGKTDLFGATKIGELFSYRPLLTESCHTVDGRNPKQPPGMYKTM